MARKDSCINSASAGDENVLSMYLKEINRIPLLSREEEDTYARAAAKGDKAAKDIVSQTAVPLLGSTAIAVLATITALQPERGPSIVVVTAARTIAAGATLTDADLTRTSMPEPASSSTSRAGSVSP